jgi:molybdopterin-guanine dinucleotide biosynthesis protein A
VAFGILTLPPGAILLVGGRSIRMGHSKAVLEWHGEPLAARLARVLARAVGDGLVVAVSAPGQELPDLPARVELVEDPTEGDGPLRGLATGLAALEGRAEIAFASSVDLPFLTAPFVTAVLAAVGTGDDAAVPVVDERRYPLPAAYRVALGPLCDDLLARGERRLGALSEQVNTRFVEVHADVLRNVNTQAEYDEACALLPPLVSVEGVDVRAWRLEEVLDGQSAAAVNGVWIESDPWYPLAPGDHISLIDRALTA